ncbi:hypothetical protein ONE63_004701 [Megalurothrips usitatus]|uniref:Prokaryotic-type class I peptide chain release factors domain-containing protein n=1 Tax=Megalurothrips usitatus TaxID=439358 RepID=A0AAV7X3U3_9NEOP|nr:hypothetical protein ONE63_004701 [Megalurothrips usitatus]
MLCSTVAIFRSIPKSPWFSLARTKFTPDASKVPLLDEKELREEFVRGSGPGGQSVAKTSNCVLLKHLPSGIVVRCHDTRSLEQNRKIARTRLVTRLDNLINGEESVEAQITRENRRRKDLREAVAKERLEKKRLLKEQLKSDDIKNKEN